MSNEKTSYNVRQARNKYARAWRKKNKDKVRAANIRYWQKKAREEMDINDG